jgi:hypothetical protein
MAHSTWRAVGQAFLICLAIGGCGVTAQDNGPGREAFATMHKIVSAKVLPERSKGG